MQRGFGGTVFEPAQPERGDREFTLGPFMLTLIGCGLFALCGLCFVFGYSVGHRNAETSSTISVPPPVAPVLSQPANPQSKPSAGQSGYEPPPPADASDNGATSGTDSGTTVPQISSSGAAAASAADSGVRTVSVVQPASGTVQPALSSQASGVVVQIAAVSHPEDADVLVGALRKRGYAVSARRDPTDGLLHVQIGPFANRNDAYAMRQKLLNDGYNAIVQP
jgi:DedD protein